MRDERIEGAGEGEDREEIEKSGKEEERNEGERRGETRKVREVGTGGKFFLKIKNQTKKCQRETLEQESGSN